MSNLHTTPGVRHFNLLSKHLLAISTESKICLPPTKEFCDSEISLSSTRLNLFSKTLDNSLYTLPTKLIGLKSLIFNALFFLGIKERKEAFRDRSNSELLWNDQKKP